MNFFRLKYGETPIPLSEYVRQCLYNKEFGYYTSQRKRVGKDGDFYTSSTLNPALFAKLIKSAAQNLCKDFEHIFEIGAEPELKLFENSKVFRVLDSFDLEKNDSKALVFSNELLDAQPFERFFINDEKIEKLFLKFDSNGKIDFIREASSEHESDTIRKYFPSENNLTLDFSFGAISLLEKICSEDWKGVLIFADYFRTSDELSLFKSGTARSYKKHSSSTDIFSNPFNEDITFSPCIEPFLDTMNQCGFLNANCMTQEIFFLTHAQDEIKNIIESKDSLDKDKRTLCELINPAHMGSSFRILFGIRE